MTLEETPDGFVWDGTIDWRAEDTSTYGELNLLDPCGFPADEVAISLGIMLLRAREDDEIDLIRSQIEYLKRSSDPDAAAEEIRQAYLEAVATWISIIHVYYLRATATLYVVYKHSDEVLQTVLGTVSLFDKHANRHLDRKRLEE